MRVIINTIVACLLLSTIVGYTQASEKTPQVQITQAGWQNMVGDGVTLSLPPGYVGGNPGVEMDEIEAKLREINPDYPRRIAPLKQHLGAIALLAFDAENITNNLITNVNITKQKLEEELTIQQYLERISRQISSTYRIQAPEIVSLNQYRAGRILAEVKVEKTQIKQLVYIVKDKDTFWTVTYATSAELFNRKLPDFEKSIQTFRLEPSETAIIIEEVNNNRELWSLSK